MEKNTVIPDLKVVIIGGSAGSLEVLLQILPKIKQALTFAIVIIVHRKGGEDTALEELLSFKAQLPVAEVEDKSPLLPGFIYIAPANYHLLFEKNNLLSLDISEKVNYSRPSIDVAFESAADIYRKSLTGILLSGANSDGTNGLKAIKNLGGISIVQNPQTAEMPFMPNNAAEHADPDFILNVEELLEYIISIDSNDQKFRNSN